MSVEELATRARRQLLFGAERIGLVGSGAPQALAWPPPGGIEGLRWPPARPAAPYLQAADEIRRGVFRFFGRRFELGDPPAWNTDPLTGTAAPLRFGKTLDYRDSRVVGDAKHLWELNRHLELVPLAQAYRLTEDRSYLDALRRLITSWIDQCPFPRGPNWCSSLELGIRLVNWHLAYRIAGGADSPLFTGAEGRQFRDRWMHCIYQHNDFIMHHLSTYPSSANNHLIGELAGVFVSCCTWPCWPVTKKWKGDARTLLHREILRQTYPDGVNKEQTTWYQQFVASLFIVAGIAGRRAGVSFEPEYWETAAKMLEFLSAIMDASGNVPMIGDADDGIVFALEPRPALDPFRSLLAIGAALFDDPTWRRQSEGCEASAEWLCTGLEPVARRGSEHPGGGPAAVNPPTRHEHARQFPEGGYYLLGRDLGTPCEVRAVVDAGPLGFLSIAGHGHADCLAMTLSVAGREQLVDPGTYAYHSSPEWRDYFRGTAAHNTVRVDGLDQSRAGGPFLWLEKAEPTVDAFERSREHDRIAAWHSGYLRLPDPVKHTREVRFDKRSGVFDIEDRLSCRGSHRVERFWHFAEHCQVQLRGRSAFSSDGVVRLHLDVEEGDVAGELLRGSVDPVSGWISRSFGHKAPTSTLVFRGEIDGDTVLRTRIRIEGP